VSVTRSLDNVGVKDTLTTGAAVAVLGIFTDVELEGVGHPVFSLGKVIQADAGSGALVELGEAIDPLGVLLKGEDGSGFSRVDAALVVEVPGVGSVQIDAVPLAGFHVGGIADRNEDGIVQSLLLLGGFVGTGAGATTANGGIAIDNEILRLRLCHNRRQEAQQKRACFKTHDCCWFSMDKMKIVIAIDATLFLLSRKKIYDKFHRCDIGKELHLELLCVVLFSLDPLLRFRKF